MGRWLGNSKDPKSVSCGVDPEVAEYFSLRYFKVLREGTSVLPDA